jgi:hypothetical protein
LKRDDVKLVSRSCGLALFLAGGAIHCGGDEVVVAASDGSVSIADTDADLDAGTGAGTTRVSAQTIRAATRAR